MAKLVVLLCLAGLLGVTLARSGSLRSRDRLHRDRRQTGRFQNYVGDRGDDGRAHRVDGFRGHRGQEEGRLHRGWRSSHHRASLEGRRNRPSHRVHRMMQNLGSSERGFRRMPTREEMENLRATFWSRPQQETGRHWDPNVSYHDLRTALGRGEGRQRYDHHRNLMERTLGQRNRAGSYLGGDLTAGQGRDTMMGDFHDTRMSPGYRPGGPRLRGHGMGPRYMTP